jgi:hypothetical protein
MPQRIKVKNSSDPGKAPDAADLQVAELALNVADKKLYSKDVAGNVFEINSSQVSISETAPANPKAGQLWWADSDIDDGGGRLYVWTGDEWVDTSLPGGGSGGGSGDGLTESEANDLYLSKVNDDTAQGALTFEGQTTHEDGVKVTGGDSDSTLRLTEGSIHLRNNDNGGTVTGVGDVSISLLGNINGASSDAFGTRSSFGFSKDYTTVAQVAARPASNYLDSGSANEAIGFYADSNIAVPNAATAIGFKSTVTGNDNYNFYAAGSAPNYFEGITEHASGVNVTGSGSVTNGLNYFSDQMQLRYKSQSLINLREGRSATDYQVRLTGRQQIDYTPVNDAPVISILPTINGQSSWQTDIFTVKPTLTGSFSSLIGLNLDFKEGIAAGTSITADNFYGVKLARTNQITTGTGKLYGVYTEVEGGSNYNFYAAGNAPNYFAGVITVSNKDDFLAQSAGPGGGSGVNIGPNGIFGARDSSTTSNSVIWTNRIATNKGYHIRFGSAGNYDAMMGIRGDGANVIALVGTSDYRAKTNVVEISNATNVIKSLRPVNYSFIDDVERTHQGFIAHELQQYVPTAAFGTKDATESIGVYTDVDGNIETDVVEPESISYGASWSETGIRDVMQTTDQTKLIPLLTKALQEVMQKNEDLETRIAALEGA